MLCFNICFYYTIYYTSKSVNFTDNFFYSLNECLFTCTLLCHLETRVHFFEACLLRVKYSFHAKFEFCNVLLQECKVVIN